MNVRKLYKFLKGFTQFDRIKANIDELGRQIWLYLSIKYTKKFNIIEDYLYQIVLLTMMMIAIMIFFDKKVVMAFE